VLLIDVDSKPAAAVIAAAAMTAAAAAAVATAPGSIKAHRENAAAFWAQYQSGHVHGGASPTLPTTPGPYGPPGMLRKPIWETYVLAC